MRRPAWFTLLLALLCAWGVAIANAEKPLPAPEGEALWSHISDKNPYTQWEFWPGYDGIYPGKSPHGAFLKLYANPLAIAAAREGRPLPEGSILVKENYGEDKETLLAITPMYKVTGYNSEAGDWFWAKYGPQGEVQSAGKVQSCIDCHQAAAADDFIFTKAK
ncbi:MAG: cytochrome P460 family protein [Desulfobacterales bacterium]